MPGNYDYEYNYDYEDSETRRNRRVRQLESVIKQFEDDITKEEELRDKSPALQDAWEAYQIVLRTVRE